MKYVTPNLEEGYVPCDWNEGNKLIKEDEFFVIKENYIRDSSFAENIVSKLFNKELTHEVKLFPGSDIGLYFLLSVLSKTNDNLYCLKEDYKQVAAFGNILFKEVKYIDSIHDLKDLEANSVFYFSNPGNPSCKYFNSKELKDLLPEEKVSIICDLAYVDFHDGFFIKDFEDYNNIYFSRTFSKFFGSAAVRLGALLYNKNSPISSHLDVVNAKWIGSVHCDLLEKIEKLNLKKRKEELNGGLNKLESFFKNKFTFKKMVKAGNFIRIDFNDDKEKQDFYIFMDSKKIAFRDLKHIASLEKSIRINYRNELNDILCL